MIRQDPRFRLTRLLLALGGLALVIVGCVKPIDLTGLPCGTNGECGAEHQCVDERCVRDFDDPDAKKAQPAFALAAACTSSSDCRSRSVSSAICKTSAGSVSWPGGYCTKSCSGDSECNPDKLPNRDGHCVRNTSASSRGECRLACQSNDDCHEGYSCQTSQVENKKVCVPE